MKYTYLSVFYDQVDSVASCGYVDNVAEFKKVVEKEKKTSFCWNQEWFLVGEEVSLDFIKLSPIYKVINWLENEANIVREEL